MLTKAPSTKLQEFVKRREEVIQFVRKGMLSQGEDKIDAARAVVSINFFNSQDIENLYKCINSNLPENTIKAMVAHDFNGLSNHDPHFVPKSRYFEEK